MLIGYLCATLVGVSLGIFGSGGSILTVPIMVYLMNVNPVTATGYSLFVVGITSAIGGATYLRKKLVNFKTALIFGVPSTVCVFLTRKLLMPLIPDIVFSTSAITVSKEFLIMFLFAVLMIIVACNMILKAGYKEPDVEVLQHYNYPQLIVIGVVSGILTGILGVGGGFIIIPALILYANISVRMSVGTSLLIIAFNSLSGFTEEVMEKHAVMDYHFLFLFSLMSVAGIFIGFSLSLKLNAVQLKKMFGWFILVVGIYIFLKELFVPLT